jgi:hypothetical protein
MADVWKQQRKLIHGWRMKLIAKHGVIGDAWNRQWKLHHYGPRNLKWKLNHYRQRNHHWKLRDGWHVDSTTKTNKRLTHESIEKHRVIGDDGIVSENWITTVPGILSENWVTINREIITENLETAGVWTLQQKLINGWRMNQ